MSEEENWSPCSPPTLDPEAEEKLRAALSALADVLKDPQVRKCGVLATGLKQALQLVEDSGFFEGDDGKSAPQGVEPDEIGE